MDVAKKASKTGSKAARERERERDPVKPQACRSERGVHTLRGTSGISRAEAAQRHGASSNSEVDFRLRGRRRHNGKGKGEGECERR